MRSEFEAEECFVFLIIGKEPYSNTRLQVSRGRWAMAIESGAGAAMIIKEQLTNNSECSGEWVAARLQVPTIVGERVSECL